MQFKYTYSSTVGRCIWAQ